MDYKYSATTGGFYPADDLEMYGDNLPADLVDVGAEAYAALFVAQAAGRRIIADSRGNPVAADQSPPTVAQLQITRDSLLADAALRLAPLQDAVDIGEATGDEKAQLLAWKKYRVSLNRLDLSTVPVTWPSVPD